MKEVVMMTKDKDISYISLDDGHVNALNLDAINQILFMLKKVPKDRGCVIIKGRSGFFSAGFDLNVIQDQSKTEQTKLVQAGCELLKTLYAFERPILMNVTGHAVGFAVFMLCCADYRIGVQQPFKLHANEVVNHMVVPKMFSAIAASRMSKRHFQRVILNGEAYSMQEGVDAGLLDELVDSDTLDERCTEKAMQLSFCTHPSYYKTKCLARSELFANLNLRIE